MIKKYQDSSPLFTQYRRHSKNMYSALSDDSHPDGVYV
jgi:hypothetical protein